MTIKSRSLTRGINFHLAIFPCVRLYLISSAVPLEMG